MYEHTNIGRLILEQVAAQEKTAGIHTPDVDRAEARTLSDGLNKIASMSYNEDTYGSVQWLLKSASECISKLCSAIESDQQKIAMFEKTAEVRAIIDDMVSYGIVDDNNAAVKVAELISETPQRLEIIKEAMKLTAGRDSENGNCFFEKQAADTSKGSDRQGMFDKVLGDF